MSQQPLLEVRNLVTEFSTEDGWVRAVNDVSFTLNRGEIIGIVGESGSGKSVTSLSTMRLIPNPPGKISGGEIVFHEPGKAPVDLVQLSEPEMRKYRGNRIAMIFQEPMTSLNPVFSCGDQVMEALMLHQQLDKKTAKEKTIQLFEKVKLPRPAVIFDSYPHQLSGGQKQQASVCYLLAVNDVFASTLGVLALDEPSGAMQESNSQDLAEAFNYLAKMGQQTGRQFIVITHSTSLAALGCKNISLEGHE